ncbi:MAG: DNA repair exonuclease [Faecalimonas sp.]|nr:DNA repair exonuclease [Faecalimonas sp.]
MKFIHVGDVHLGSETDWTSFDRKREVWDTFESVIAVCEEKQVDLLLLSGDLFHRQPLVGELKEVNQLFAKLSHTKVVFIAGNHDYVKSNSYYRSFAWSENVYPLLDTQMDCAEFPELATNVYGFSYHQRELAEPLYDTAYAPRKARYEILLAHGGDEKHIPVKKEVLAELGYDYIAMGHIHKPQVVLENKAIYAGILEPTDKNDIGKHGYVYGEICEQGVKTEFVPCASREFVHAVVQVEEHTTGTALKEQLRTYIQETGMQHMYKFILQGKRDADIQFDLESLKTCGTIFELLDETQPAYDFEKLLEANEGNLLGKYIESLKDFDVESIEYEALCLGVQALMEAKRG